MKNPEEFMYTKEHEWIHMTSGQWQVGITDYAQAHLGGVVFVELPDIGAELNKGDALASLESVKAVAEIYMPADGEITEINSDLENEPEKLNEDPYGAWIVVISTNAGADPDWMDASDYTAYCEDL